MIQFLIIVNVHFTPALIQLFWFHIFQCSKPLCRISHLYQYSTEAKVFSSSVCFFLKIVNRSFSLVLTEVWVWPGMKQSTQFKALFRIFPCKYCTFREYFVNCCDHDSLYSCSFVAAIIFFALITERNVTVHLQVGFVLLSNLLLHLHVCVNQILYFIGK